ILHSQFHQWFDSSLVQTEKLSTKNLIPRPSFHFMVARAECMLIWSTYDLFNSTSSTRSINLPDSIKKGFS
uniref:Ovule protein n=1 Tax=Panagrolaimus sp. ES5 TaxID=591445 RepID=A0AC34FUF6_9BILA